MRGLCLALALAACAPGPPAGPPDLRAGEDVCDECHMIVSETRFAAGYRTADGAERLFDDIGDMAAFAAREREDVATWWVHDFAGGGWGRAEDASFVAGGDVKTPMGHGIVAFHDRAAAEAFVAERGGRLLDLDEVLAGEGALEEESSGAPAHDHDNQGHEGGSQ